MDAEKDDFCPSQLHDIANCQPNYSCGCFSLVDNEASKIYCLIALTIWLRDNVGSENWLTPNVRMDWFDWLVSMREILLGSKLGPYKWNGALCMN
jgi:hypothetical protein